MKPTIGRIVIVIDTNNPSNGTNHHPAVVTRVRDGSDTRNAPALVNVTVLPDLAAPYTLGSIQLHDDRLSAETEATERRTAAAYWPPRD